MTTETHSFQAETQKLLDLMIHSLYSHKEVFLRELISNASDAIDRRRFVALTDPALAPEGEPAIEIRIDPEARSLEVRDDGIGMSRDEVVEQIGTIARSGTAEFLKAAADTSAEGKAEVTAEGSDASLDLIGQFGVGFYASFMVAEEVVLETRRAGDEAGTRWRSAADGHYTLEPCERDIVGTTVHLRLKAADPEAGLADFSSESMIRDVVKRYSDFVAHPIRLHVEGRDEQSSEPLNSRKAIWTRPESEVDEDEYREFYRHISHDPRDPLLRISTVIEGNFEARALLYVPSKAPFDLYHRERTHRGIGLYVKRVFIMDECRDLMPEYLRFVAGVVDAEDVSLNVSRELLQQDPQIQAIRRHLAKKVLESLADLAARDEDDYLAFWAEFGPVLKEGLLLFEEKNKDKILDLVRCASTHDDTRLTSLAAVVERMGEGQEVLYFLTGASREAAMGSPHLEAFRARGIEVLVFSDPVDEVWLQQMPPEYRGKRFQAVGEGEIAFGDESPASEEERKAEAERDEEVQSSFKALLAVLRAAVQDGVKEVRLSKRLTESAAVLARDEGDLSPSIVEMLRQAGQQVERPKPILELNPEHALLVRLREIHDADPTDARLPEAAQLLFDQAILAEGAPLDDPARFARKVADWMARGL